jgi:dihydroneopterin aldolase
MITVALNNLQFFAFHGILEEEKKIGNDYLVNVSLDFHENADLINHINDTINYEYIYQLIRKRMSVPTPLLETIAMESGNQIHDEFPDLKSIFISIKKMHPPIEGIQGSAEVCWQKKF